MTTTTTDTPTTDETTTTSEPGPEVTTSEPGTEPRRRVRHSGTATPLTDEQAATLAARMPDDPVRLSPDDLACADCGATVLGPHDPAAVIYAETAATALPVGRDGDLILSRTTPSRGNDEPLTYCARCSTRNAAADDLTAALLPRGVTVHGLSVGPDGARSHVRAALLVLDLLGHDTPTADDLDPNVLGLILARLTHLAPPMRWASRFAPVWHPDARAGTAAPRRWAHVRESDRLTCRRAYVGLMADRLAASAPPVNLTPPARLMARPGTVVLTSACLLCGVGSIERPALAVARDGGREAAALKVWEVRTTAPDALGARRSPASLAGWTCPPCSEACHWAGAVGPSAMERALLVALGLTGRHWPTSATMPGLIGWGALAADAARAGRPVPQPNPTAWAHLGDLDTVRSRLGHDLGGRR